MGQPFYTWQSDILEAGDVARFRNSWAKMAPHLPQPKDDREGEIMLHHARTQAEYVQFNKRAYSHQWLKERSIPSGLPDNLKPRAERLYSRIVMSVGISCNTSNPLLKPAVALIQTAMENAVEDCYAEGRTDPAFVAQRMAAARRGETQHLFGTIAVPRS